MPSPEFPTSFARLVRDYHGKYPPMRPDDIVTRIYQAMAQDDRDALIDADGLALLAMVTAALTRLIEFERKIPDMGPFVPVLNEHEDQVRAFIDSHHLTQQTIEAAAASSRLCH